MLYLHHNPAVPHGQSVSLSIRLEGKANGVNWVLRVSQTGSVYVEVNGGYNRQTVDTPLSVVRQVIRAWRDYLKTIPDLTMFNCIPYNGDGYGERRARFYETFGFREKLSLNDIVRLIIAHTWEYEGSTYSLVELESLPPPGEYDHYLAMSSEGYPCHVVIEHCRYQGFRLVMGDHEEWFFLD